VYLRQITNRINVEHFGTKCSPMFIHSQKNNKLERKWKQIGLSPLDHGHSTPNVNGDYVPLTVDISIKRLMTLIQKSLSAALWFYFYLLQNVFRNGKTAARLRDLLAEKKMTTGNRNAVISRTFIYYQYYGA
jgi:hypothetical protein